MRCGSQAICFLSMYLEYDRQLCGAAGVPLSQILFGFCSCDLLK
jgi:hypothetical protein